jgi:DNA-binding IscR family transcriptional regulator
MLKELKGMEYTLEVLRAFQLNPGQHDSKKIAKFIQDGGKITPSLTYLAKILPRMRKAGLLTSSGSGYQLDRPIDEIMVDKVLDICPMPEEDSPSFKLCSELKSAVSLTGIDEFYNFE